MFIYSCWLHLLNNLFIFYIKFKKKNIFFLPKIFFFDVSSVKNSKWLAIWKTVYFFKKNQKNKMRILNKTSKRCFGWISCIFASSNWRIKPSAFGAFWGFFKCFKILSRVSWGIMAKYKYFNVILLKKNDKLVFWMVFSGWVGFFSSVLIFFGELRYLLSNFSVWVSFFIRKNSFL